MTAEESIAIDLAGPLCRNVGLAEPKTLERLAGGKNNRVYRLVTARSERVILKSYFSDPRDTRDRLGAEWSFLTFVWGKGLRNVPQPLACDRANHLGLYSMVPGEKLTSDKIEQVHVDEALSFVLRSNTPRGDLSDLPAGSEACFSVHSHLETVEARVGRLKSLDSEAPLLDEAEKFIAGTLVPTWHELRSRIEDQSVAYGINTRAELPLDRQCASPSDFGFHNALVAETTSFIDFEYAGRDDPAKLVSDLFCCPEVSVPIRYHTAFIKGMVEGLNLLDEDRFRCEILLNAYRVKWACIIMNTFLPTGAARRGFANLANNKARCESQLRAARQMLVAIQASN